MLSNLHTNKGESKYILIAHNLQLQIVTPQKNSDLSFTCCLLYRTGQDFELSG